MLGACPPCRAFNLLELSHVTAAATTTTTTTYYYYFCRRSKSQVDPHPTRKATSLIPIFFHFLTYDFSQSQKPAGPLTTEERLVLCSVYLRVCVCVGGGGGGGVRDFVVPLVMLLDACFSSAYREPAASVKRKQGSGI